MAGGPPLQVISDDADFITIKNEYGEHIKIPKDKYPDIAAKYSQTPSPSPIGPPNPESKTGVIPAGNEGTPQPGLTETTPPVEQPQPMMGIATKSGRQSETQKKTLSPENKALLGNAFKSGLTAIEAKNVAETAAANAKATEYELQTSEMGKKLKENQVTEWQTENNRVEMLDDIKRKQVEYDSKSIDPNHFWSDKSTGQKIMAALAIGLGSLGGGNNTALEIIDGAIKRDIDAQQSNLNKTGKSLEIQRGGYQDFLTLTQSRRVAFASEWERQAQVVGKRLDGVIARTQDPIQKANALSMKADWDMKYAQNRAELEQEVSKTAVTNGLTMTTPKPTKPAGEKPLPPKVDEERRNLEETYSGLQILKRLKENVDGNTGPVAVVQQRAAEILGLTNPTKAQLKAATVKLLASTLKTYEGGKPSDADAERLAGMTPNMGQNDETFQAMADSVREGVTNKYIRLYQDYSVHPAGYYFPSNNPIAQELISYGKQHKGSDMGFQGNNTANKPK